MARALWASILLAICSSSDNVRTERATPGLDDGVRCYT